MKRLSSDSSSKSPSPRRDNNSKSSGNGRAAGRGGNSDGSNSPRCNLEHGVAEINSQLCSTMLTMILSEDAAKQYCMSRSTSSNNHTGLLRITDTEVPKRGYKTLGSSVIYSPMLSSSMYFI